MKRTILRGAVTALMAVSAAAAPQITAILNAASYAQQGLPNYGIAPGSIFVVFGTELGPPTLQVANDSPLPTTLAGTSMRVTVGSTTVNAIMVYTSATQAAAILPSNTPVGIGLLAVTFQGHTSQSGAFRILRSAPGLLTQNQAGSGPALATTVTAGAELVRNGWTHAAHPGQVVTLWATGLGPTSGNDAATPVPQDLNVNLQVLLGGQPALVRYKGRSGCCAGVDQINIEIPRGVEGCSVPVVVQSGDFISNFANLSIASTGDVCTGLDGVSGADLQAQGARPMSVGSIALNVYPDCDDYYNPCPAGGTTYAEKGRGSFSRWDRLPAFGQTPPDSPSPGSCYLTHQVLVNAVTGFVYVEPAPLDAGPVLNVSGPKGTKQIVLRSPGDYSSTFSSGNAKVQFLEPGEYVVDNGTGGADVGPFRATLTVPKAFTSSVQRSAIGVKVSWTGGSPSSIVFIRGSTPPGFSGVSTSFVCAERVAAGQFTLPAEVLLSLPPDTPDRAGLNISVSGPSLTVFRAKGLDFGELSFNSSLVQ